MYDKKEVSEETTEKQPQAKEGTEADTWRGGISSTGKLWPDE